MKRIKVLQWSCQTLDYKMIEMLWENFMRAVYKQISTNINEMTKHYKEKWAKTPPQLHETDKIAQKKITSS